MPRNNKQCASIFRQMAVDLEQDQPPVITLSQGFNECYAARFSSNKDRKKQRSHMARIIEIIGDLDVSRIKATQVNKLKTCLLEEGLCGSTVNRYLATLKATLRWIRQNSMPELSIPHIPIDHKSERIREHIVSKEEEKPLIADAKANGDQELADLIIVPPYTGLRVSEALNMVYGKHIKLRGRTLTVSSSQAKSGKARTLPMADKVFEVLARRKEKSRGGKPFSMDATKAGKRFNKQKERLELYDPDLVLHSLRHTACTRMLEGRADSMLVQDYLGHSTPVVTRRYLHFTTRHLTACSKIMNRYGGGDNARQCNLMVKILPAIGATSQVFTHCRNCWSC